MGWHWIEDCEQGRFLRQHSGLSRFSRCVNCSGFCLLRVEPHLEAASQSLLRTDNKNIKRLTLMMDALLYNVGTHVRLSVSIHLPIQGQNGIRIAKQQT